MRKRSPGKDAVLSRGRKRPQKTEKQDEKRKQKKGHDRMFRGGFDRALLVCVLLPFVAQAQVNINDARVILNSGKSLEQAIADGDLSGSGTPFCTAAQLAADSCGGTTTGGLAIVTDALNAEVCETGGGSIRHACVRNAAGAWLPNKLRGASLIIAASDANASWKGAADFVCAALRCDVEIQAAIDLACAHAGTSTNGSLVFSEGTFQIEQAISIPCNGLQFRGQGVDATSFQTPSNGCVSNDGAHNQGSAGCDQFVWTGTHGSTFLEFRDYSAVYLGTTTTYGAHLITANPPGVKEVWDVGIHGVFVRRTPSPSLRLAAWGLRLMNSVVEYGDSVCVELLNGSAGIIANNKIGGCQEGAIYLWASGDASCPSFGQAGSPVCVTAGAQVIGNWLESGGESKPIVRLSNTTTFVGNQLVVKKDVEAAAVPNYGIEVVGTRNLISSNSLTVNPSESTAGIYFGSSASQNVGLNNLLWCSPNCSATTDLWIDDYSPANNEYALNNLELLVTSGPSSFDYMRSYYGPYRFVNEYGYGPRLYPDPTPQATTADWPLRLPASKGIGGQSLARWGASEETVWESGVAPGANWSKNADCIGLWLTAYSGSPATDVCSNANSQAGADDATDVGTPASQAASPAGSGSNLSAQLDTGDYFSVADDAAFEAADFTVGCWLRCDAGTLANCNYSVIQHFASNVGWFLNLGGNGRLSMNLGTGSSTVSSTAPSGSAIALNTWYHLAASYGGSSDDKIRVYIDGQPACNDECTTAPTVSLAAAAVVQVGGASMNASLKDCFYFDRVLSQQELVSIARCGALNADIDATRAASFANLASIPGVACSN